MRLNPLSTRPRPLTREIAERERVAANLPHWHVVPLEGVEADRERSLREELDSVTPDPEEPAVAPEQRARDTAARLRRLGPAALRLLKYEATDTPNPRRIDAVA